MSWITSILFGDLESDTGVLAAALTDLATARGRAVATIERRLSAIAQWHKLQSYVTPTRDERVRLVLGGIRRRLGTAQGRHSSRDHRARPGHGGWPATLRGRGPYLHV